MDVVFRKRRYYQGKLRDVGDVVKNMNYKHARAFIRVHAAIPYVHNSKSAVQVKAPPLKTRRTRVKPSEPKVDTIEEVNIIPGIVEEVAQVDVTLNTEDNPVVVFEEFSYRELQKACQEKELSAGGTKAELIERLKAQKG
jgi:hypothetical protein